MLYFLFSAIVELKGFLCTFIKNWRVLCHYPLPFNLVQYFKNTMGPEASLYRYIITSSATISTEA